MSAPWTSSPETVVVALVRHGRTAWNAERRFLGRTDIPLDACGEAQVRALGATCPTRFHKVYTSPLARARATALVLDDTPDVLADVVEMAQGELEGKGRAELVGEHADFFARWLLNSAETSPPGGESLVQTRDRALPALIDVARRQPMGNVIAVVSHQMVIASVSCTIANDELSNWRDYGIPNAAVTWLAWDGAAFAMLERGWRTPEVAAIESEGL